MRLFSRSETAQRLGIVVRTLRGLEDAGKIVPAKGRKGTRRGYTLTEIMRYMEASGKTPRRVITAPKPDPEGETAARVFDALKEGKTKIEIVTRLRLHPDEVETFALKYEKMRREQEELPPAPCVKCGESAARFCGGCVEVPTEPRAPVRRARRA